MPTSTFTPGDEKQDEKLNPGQQDANRRFGDLADSEKRGTIDMGDFERNFGENADSSQEDANIKKLENNEASSAPSREWENNVSSVATKTTGRFKGWFKKASPALGIGGVIGIGGMALLALTSPALLIVQMKETMVGKFNTQLSSMEARSNKILYAKMNGATSGFCNSKLTIRCKFTSMTEKQVAKLKAAGIEVEGDKAITGRIKPKQMTFKGTVINARDFATTAGTNADFRNALKQAYNPKYAGFVGKAWANVATKYKINKQAPELNADEDPEKAREKINQIAEEGTDDTGSRTRVTGDAPDCEGSACSGISEADAEKINADAEAISGAAKDGSAASDVRAKLSGVNSGAVSSFFKLSAPLDYACQGYGALTTLSYAAKAIRAAQLVRYAVLFMGIADTIKAGESPEPEDVSLLGRVLTTNIKSTEDPTNTLIGSATDSYGYKYAAYGDSSASEQSMQISNRFMAGGGFVGQMSAVTAAVLTPLGGRSGAKATCGFLANPLVQGASIVLGIASLFVPGANVAKIAASAASGVAVSVAIAVLPGMLAEIVAGTVTKDIVGEEAGNAITSGSGTLMSDALAAQNGNAPMSKNDAVAYNNLQVETRDQYIADELKDANPFDATNPHTFLGSIATALIPLQSSSNPVTKVGSLITSSLGSIIPSSNAVTIEQYSKSLDVCQDMDVIEAGYAADPFCNVIRGIPPKYLDKDPFLVVDQLQAAGDLSEDGTPTGNYSSFITSCITNEEPLGYQSLDTGFDQAAAAKCVINDDNANYYLNYVDQRVELGLSDEDTVDGEAATSDVAGTAIDIDNLYKDSTAVACAVNTIDKGLSTGYNNGTAFPIRICALPNSDEPSKDGGMAIVNSRVSGAAYAMFEQMKKDIGVEKIPFGDSFRSPEEQQAAINDCGLYSNGGCAAAQGYSNHQSGVALDFEYTNAYCSHSRGIVTCPASPFWTWLKTNGEKFGFKNGVDEWWHWSPTGG
jgi:hypothetical protein